MKRIFLISLTVCCFLIIALFILSCKSKDTNNYVLEKWNNGNPKIVKEYINKAENDFIYTEFYKNGNLKTKEIYFRNQLDGSAKYFDEEGYLSKEKKYRNGMLESEYTYKFGRLEGPEKIYHSNGQLWTERILQNGKPLKVISNFDSTGKPMDPGTLNDGYGTIRLYDKKGNLIEIKNYRDGMEVINKEQINK